MTREEAIERIVFLKGVYSVDTETALDMAIEALQADTVSREVYDKRTQADEEIIDSYRKEFQMFAESEEAYKAWTGEEMGKTSDEINEMNKEIIKDILKMMPTAYLLEALGVSTFEELTEQADRPHGEWIIHTDDLFPEESTQECSVCHKEQFILTGNDDNYCPNCGAKMGGDGE